MPRDENEPVRRRALSPLTRGATARPRPAAAAGQTPPIAALLGRAAAVAVLVVVCVALLLTQTRLLDRFQNDLSDWRATLAGPQRADAHPEITLLLVREASLLPTGVYSPVDRAIVADMVRLIDGFGPEVIGLDFILDIETANDAELLAAIRAAAAPVVLGSIGPEAAASDAQLAVQARLLAAADRPTGRLDLAVDFDEVVRRRATFYGDPAPVGFADLLAARGDVAQAARFAEEGARIDWLLPPAPDARPFLRLYVDEVEPLRLAPQLLEQFFADRIVIVGAGLANMTDYHRTPLDRGDFDQTVGAEIVAQMAAQRLDGRVLRETSVAMTLLAVAAAAFFAAMMVLRFGSWFWDGVIVLTALFVLDLAMFAFAGVASPLGALWFAGVAAIAVARNLRPRPADAAAEAS